MGKHMASGGLFKTVRIFILLAVLMGVAMGTWATRYHATSWDDPLWVVVYPINGDGSEASSRYIEALEEKTFTYIEDFMAWEGERYGLALEKPVTIKLAPPVDELPPEPPRDKNVLKVMWWSLKLRYWAYTVDTYEGPPQDVRMFVLYYDPATHSRLEDSLGLQKGMICVARAFAHWRMENKNKVVIAHELFHTVGATDKYDPATGQPRYPDGYAEPDLDPLYPQKEAEIMAGRIPLSDTDAEMPESLYYTVIGEQTAREIRWIE